MLQVAPYASCASAAMKPLPSPVAAVQVWPARAGTSNVYAVPIFGGTRPMQSAGGPASTGSPASGAPPPSGGTIDDEPPSSPGGTVTTAPPRHTSEHAPPRQAATVGTR